MWNRPLKGTCKKTRMSGRYATFILGTQAFDSHTQLIGPFVKKKNYQQKCAPKNKGKKMWSKEFGQQIIVGQKKLGGKNQIKITSHQ